MELTLHAEQQGLPDIGENVRSALWVIGENAGHIKQGLAKLSGRTRAKLSVNACPDHSGTCHFQSEMDHVSGVKAL